MVRPDHQGSDRPRHSPRHQVRPLRAPHRALRRQRLLRQNHPLLPHRDLRRRPLAHDLQMVRGAPHREARRPHRKAHQEKRKEGVSR